MMYEGNSCMYGGIYLIRKSSLEDSELLSHYTSNKRMNLMINVPVNNLLIVIIHYRGYSAHRIIFKATYQRSIGNGVPVDLKITHIGNKTATLKTLKFGVGLRKLIL